MPHEGFDSDRRDAELRDQLDAKRAWADFERKRDIALKLRDVHAYVDLASGGNAGRWSETMTELFQIARAYAGKDDFNVTS